MANFLGGFNMSISKSSRRPGMGVHRGSLNPKITIATSTASTTASQFPNLSKKNDLFYDATVSPVVVYWYDGTNWHQ